jgi:hypothetical protein
VLEELQLMPNNRVIQQSNKALKNIKAVAGVEGHMSRHYK